jgi:hypothetical protein
LGDNQKRDSIGRFKKKRLKGPSFDTSNSSVPRLKESEAKAKPSILEKIKPKKFIMPEYNPVLEAMKLESALSKPKGLFGKKKQLELKKEVERKFGDIDWNPDAKFEETTLSEEETASISTYDSPTSRDSLRSYDGRTGRAYRFIKSDSDEITIVKIAENAELKFVEIAESLDLDQNDILRNQEHVIIVIGDHNVRLPLNTIIFKPKN